MVVSGLIRTRGSDVFSSSSLIPTGITPDIGVLCRREDGVQAVSRMPRSQEALTYSWSYFQRRKLKFQEVESKETTHTGHGEERPLTQAIEDGQEAA